jgi:NADPH:quinone reductase-like Zn-dependent oxidoreductase
MCRAIWVLVVGSSAEECKALRRAAGPDAQVVGMAESADQARELAGSSEADVLVVSAGAPGARELLTTSRPDAAIVWVGADAPDQADASIPEVSDELEGAITRGLLARRAAK